MTIDEIRRENLRALRDRKGGPAMLAEALDKSPSYISQVIGANPRKRIGDQFAREIEARLGLPNGWMDTTHHGARKASTVYELGHPEPVRSLQEVPVVGTVEGGPDQAWEEFGYPSGYGDALVQAASHDTNAYALYVSGNSMAPRMRPGEAILVEPGQEAAPGDEVVVKIVEHPHDPNLTGGAVMVKEFASQRDGRIALDSIADHEERVLVHCRDIEFMHYVAGTFRAGSIRPREE